MRSGMILALALAMASATLPAQASEPGRAAEPVSAAKAMRTGLTICNSDLRAGRFQTATAYVRCQLSVANQFAQASQFDKPQLMSAYSSRLLQLAATYDARQISLDTFQGLLVQTQQQFTRAVGDDHVGATLPPGFESGVQHVLPGAIPAITAQ